MKRLAASLLATAAVFSASSAAMAASATVYGGLFDVFDTKDKWMGGAEYNFDYIWKNLRPSVGGFMTDQHSYYLYGNVAYDFFLTDAHSWHLTPDFGAGYYNHGDGKDLGGGFEFREGVTAGYKFEDGQRLGLALHHLSNASIYDRNPGVETLTVRYTLPFGQ